MLGRGAFGEAVELEISAGKTHVAASYTTGRYSGYVRKFRRVDRCTVHRVCGERLMRYTHLRAGDLVKRLG